VYLGVELELKYAYQNFGDPKTVAIARYRVNISTENRQILMRVL
jgi:hypothetical protein